MYENYLLQININTMINKLYLKLFMYKFTTPTFLNKLLISKRKVVESLRNNDVGILFS